MYCYILFDFNIITMTLTIPEKQLLQQKRIKIWFSSKKAFVTAPDLFVH